MDQQPCEIRRLGAGERRHQRQHTPTALPHIDCVPILSMCTYFREGQTTGTPIERWNEGTVLGQDCLSLPSELEHFCRLSPYCCETCAFNIQSTTIVSFSLNGLLTGALGNFSAPTREL